ncbi:receptor-type tyrosine-protein phosphatase C isoform X4 [Tribolium castaneum]|uniref:receptor-type tyrosine-protein phosphatase C isoform X4 n=1 Tax=Tribolium castaneum TaxID=7070 RepID=UPI0030FE2C43
MCTYLLHAETCKFIMFIFYFFWGPVVSAEIITLSNKRNITCVLTGSEVSQSVYINPPLKTDFDHSSHQTGTWIYDDWSIINSSNTNQSLTLDKRWETFKLLDENRGCALKNNNLVSMSVCTSDNITITIYSNDHSSEKSITVTIKPIHQKIPKNKCSWYHFSILNKDQIVKIMSQNGEVAQEVKLDFDASWLYFSPKNKIAWKLHEYLYRAANHSTKALESNVAITFGKNLCLSLYVSVDKNCFLDISLESNNKIKRTTVLGFNEENSYKKWERIEIHAEAPGPGQLFLVRGFTQIGVKRGFWAIDDIRFCHRDMEIYKIESNENVDDHVCEVLYNSDQVLQNNDQKNLSCNDARFFAKHCNISCTTALGKSFPYCEKHRICYNESSCSCSWGYQGTTCETPCDRGSWGLFCQKKCDKECFECHPSTGKCLINKTENVNIEYEIPLSVELILPTNYNKNKKETTYHLKLLCESQWCLNQVVEENVLTNYSTRLVFKKFVPFTNYRLIVTAQKQNHAFQERYYAIEAKPFFPPVINNLSVYSKNLTTLWIRFQVSEKNGTYYIWYTDQNVTVPPNKVTARQCELWSNFLCGRIENLQPATNYIIVVESKKTKTTKWNVSPQVSALTLEEESEAPQNLHLTTSDDNAYINWEHPFVINGPIRKFYVVIKTNGKIENKTVNVKKTQKSYKYKYFVLHLKRKLKNKKTHYDNIVTGDEALLGMKNNPEMSSLIHLEDFEQYVKNAAMTGKLTREFRALPTTSAESTTTGLLNKNQNKNKNSFNTPYDFSRVILSKLEGVGSDDYINASYISGFDRPKVYIATQGPKFATIRDFWRMIWQEQADTIVMATNFMEDKKRKCGEYFPQRLGTLCEYGEMRIKLVSERLFEHYDSRIFVVSYRESERRIQHLQMKWSPDDLKPLYANCLVPLVKRIREIRMNSKKPMVIHCSSGMNRTGTLILCDLAETVKAVDFYALLKKMRNERPNMITSEKQYVLAHLVVLECLTEEKHTLKKAVEENFSETFLKTQLNHIERLQWLDDVVKSSNQPNNKAPSYRYLDGTRKFLITQQPTRLLCNFWCVVANKNVEAVIFLNKTTIPMWPYRFKNSDSTFNIEELKSVGTKYCTSTTLIISECNKGRTVRKNVIFFQMNISKLNEQTDDFLNIVDVLESTFKSTGPILVACHDGITLCGLFVTLSRIINKLLKDSEIDVCGAIRYVRRCNPQFVKTSEQLEFLYRVIMHYLQKFDRYVYVV